MKQALALLLALLTALLFASCGGTAEPAIADESTAPTTRAQQTGAATQPEITTSQQQPSTAPEETTTVSESTSAPAETTTQTAQSTKALTQAELLAMYNNALGASALKRRDYKRSLSAGGLWRTSEPEAVLNLAEEEGVVALLKLSDSQAVPSDLSALDSSWVQSITARESGGKTLLTIQLKGFSRSNFNGTAEAGYPGIVPLDECKTLIKDIGKSMYNVSAVSVSSSSTGMSGGTLTATLSGGRLESVSYKAQQNFDADLKILAVIGAGLTITFALSAEYR